MSGGDPPLLTERDGPLAVLRLNRPDRLNAVSLPLYRLLVEALASLASERDVRAVVLIGAGRAFCVGADLKAHGEGEPTEEERRHYVGTAQRANRALQRLPKPVVAAVNGHAIGAGLELALSCDVIVAARDAKLRLPELALGTFVGGGTVYTLPGRVGWAAARRMLLLAQTVSGEEAARIGLVDRAVPSEEVFAAAMDWGKQLVGRAPVPVALAKDLLDRARHLESEEALGLEAEALLRCMATRDWREGVRAFAEKREPEFTGE